MLDPTDLPPFGECCVCRKSLDNSSIRHIGYCQMCRSYFCWNECGGWGDLDHECENCKRENLIESEELSDE